MEMSFGVNAFSGLSDAGKASHILSFPTDGNGPLQSLTRTIDRSRDNLQRPPGFTLGSDLAVGYGYGVRGRLASISVQGLPNLSGKSHALE